MVCRIRAGGGELREGRGTASKTIKGGGIEKRGGETKFKKRGKLGQRLGVSKMGGCNPLRNYG